MIKIDGVPIEINYYPDGTPRINLDIVFGHKTIEWFYELGEEIILYFIVKHLRNGCFRDYGFEGIHLYLPYIPNARMDRVKNESEVFTLKFFCEFINSLNFDSVIVKDPHSSVATALLNNVTEYNISRTIEDVIKMVNPDIMFYPDEGAAKRYSEIISFPYIFGIKKRNWEDGKILGLDVMGEIPTKPFNVLICDDISSYGGTFLHSARKLKELGANKIYLYITHCEDSILEGELINSGLLEKIYTTNSIFKGEHPLIEVIGG